MNHELIKPIVRDYHTKKEYDFNNYISACRNIVENHQCLVINDVLVDVQSANLAIEVYDNLNQKNQERTLAIPIERFIKFAWGIIT